MSKVLLREYHALCEGGVCQDLLTEEQKIDIKENNAMYLSGLMQHADKPNGNMRVYPHNILEREIEVYKKLVRDNRALGELDHPDDSVINLKNASHMVVNIWMEGKKVMGVVKVLPTPSGDILRSLVEGGCQLGISSRGLGSVRESMNGGVIVEDDFQLICFDFVSEPSTPNAFMHLKEGKQYREPNIFTKADRINRALNDILRKK
ncbi:MAG: primosomal protein [Vampirovibrionia bacterium]